MALRKRPPRPRVLVVTADAAHGPPSGAGPRDEYDVFVLCMNENEWRLSQQCDSGARLLERIPASGAIDEQVRTWLVRHAMEIVHLTIAEAAVERAAVNLGIPVVDSASPAAGRGTGRAASAGGDSASLHDAEAGLMARYRECIGETAPLG